MRPKNTDILFDKILVMISSLCENQIIKLTPDNGTKE
jgi:hypothetical protein